MPLLAPPPSAPALAAGPLPRVLVLAGSAAAAGTTVTAAVLAASVAALGRPVRLADADAGPALGDALGADPDPFGPAPLCVVDAGARLAAVRAALAAAGLRAAALLVVTGADAASLAAAHALAKAAGPEARLVEAVLVGADPARAAEAHARLDAAARHFLGRPLGLAAAVPADPTLAVALGAGMPVHDAAAGSPAAAALQPLAERAARAESGAGARADRRPAPALGFALGSAFA